MAGQPNSGSPLDKLSKDVSQYRRTHVAGKPSRPRTAADVTVRQVAAGEPGWTELDSTVRPQILVGLLIVGYALLMVVASLAVIFLTPSASPVLWAVMAIGVIVAMIACHKGCPPLLWFMYGSVLPMVPLVHAALMGKLGALAVAAGSGQDVSGLGPLQSLLGASQAASGSVMDLLAFVCVLGAIPLVHSLLVPQDQAALEARQMVRGMKKCPFCAELIKHDARLCRYCGKDLPAAQS